MFRVFVIFGVSLDAKIVVLLWVISCSPFTWRFLSKVVCKFSLLRNFWSTLWLASLYLSSMLWKVFCFCSLILFSRAIIELSWRWFISNFSDSVRCEFLDSFYELPSSCSIKWFYSDECFLFSVELELAWCYIYASLLSRSSSYFYFSWFRTSTRASFNHPLLSLRCLSYELLTDETALGSCWASCGVTSISCLSDITKGSSLTW